MVKRYPIAGTISTPSGWHHYVSLGDYQTIQAAAREVVEQMDLTCMRANEEISVAEGCPCAVCVLQRLAADGEVK